MAQITKSYEPHDVEKKWYADWLAAGCFAGRADPKRRPYTIMIPPPNVTGVLTMGHVLNNTLQDILVRRARLEGCEALWLPGTDHAGIATQSVVERELRKEKKTRHHLGREKFLEKVWSWREEKGGIILKQLQALGASADWSRTQFTMDPAYSQAVLKVFVDLYGKGHIYRGKRMVNWCPGSLTALSDEEVIMKPVKGTIYQVRYERTDAPGQFIEVKTTRPETIPGDVAIAVHPEDPRYTAWIGKKVKRPIGPAADIPIIADAAVDKEFGSGALKITPAHDKVDFEVGTAPQTRADRRAHARCPSQRAGRPGAGRPGSLRRPQEGRRIAQGTRQPREGGTLREQRRLFGARRRADRTAPDVAVVAQVPRVSRKRRRRYATVTSSSIPSAGPRFICIGWRTFRTGASAASCGGAIASRCGTPKGSTRRR